MAFAVLSADAAGRARKLPPAGVADRLVGHAHDPGKARRRLLAPRARLRHPEMRRADRTHRLAVEEEPGPWRRARAADTDARGLLARAADRLGILREHARRRAALDARARFEEPRIAGAADRPPEMKLVRLGHPAAALVAASHRAHFGRPPSMPARRSSVLARASLHRAALAKRLRDRPKPRARGRLMPTTPNE